MKKVQHLPQLLTLKQYSESQDQIARDVEKQDRLFDEMAAEIQQGSFAYTTMKQVRRRFGEPVFERGAVYLGQMRTQWLYRYAKDFDGDKVYLYFDEDGVLVGFDFVKQP